MSKNEDEIRNQLIQDRKAQIAEEQAKINQQYRDQLENLRTQEREVAETKFASSVENLITLSKKLTESGQNGFDTWVAAMSQILNVCRAIVEANPLGNSFGELFNQASDYARNNIGIDIRPGALIGNLAAPNALPVKDMVLPGLQYFVNFEGDKLKFDSQNVRRSDGVELSHDLKAKIDNGMREAITAFLKLKGYEEKKDPQGRVLEGAFVSTVGQQPLIKAKFDGLRRELDAELTKRHGLNIDSVEPPAEEAPSTSPSP